MKTVLRSVSAVLLAVILFCSLPEFCLAAQSEKQVTLTLSVSPAEAGFAVGSGTYDERTPITLDAVAGVGYKFVNWSTAGDVICSESKNYTFLLSEDTELVANFTRVELTKGSVPVILTQDSRAEANHGITVDTAAMAALDSEFSNALKHGQFEFRWYKNEKIIPEAKSDSRSFTAIDIGSSFFVQVLYGEHYSSLDSFTVSPESTPSPVTRIYGADRYKTAFSAADALKAELGVYRFENVVIASGTNFADALSGSYLASVKNAPMLLVCQNEKIMADVKAYVKENLSQGGTVYILGGENAVPAAMEESLDGFNVVRLGGADRYETNLLILNEAGVSADSKILVCTGTNFADSLSASATALPIMLVNKTLSEKQTELLKKASGTKYIIGGPSAVSAEIEETLKAFGEVKRIGGANRYETSVLVAQEFFSSPSSAVLAYAQNFPDGLSAGPLAAKRKAPLILTSSALPKLAAEYARENGITKGSVLGGSGLISDSAVREIFSMDVRVLIDGSETKWNLTVVNRQNPMSSDYSPVLSQVNYSHKVDSRIVQSLNEMLTVANNAGCFPVICSSYRTEADQQELFLGAVATQLEKGLSLSEAEAAAAKTVALPGTSEHQLGLAVDIVDSSYQLLDEAQENTASQKWLMANSWKYGFILRYPEGKSDITGIDYEPWHYRYVGTDAAKLIYEKGITLEEYIAYHN